MSCLNDANITRLVGVCFSDDPVCLVLEYHKFGDLKRFLRRHVVDVGTMTQRNAGTDILRSVTIRYDTIRYGTVDERALKS